MTYAELLAKLKDLSQEQLQTDVVVEIPWDDECIPAIFCVASPSHDLLDQDHPIIQLISSRW